MVDDQTRKSGLKEWTSFLEAQEKVVGKDAIQRWARTLKTVHFDAGNLYLEAADLFQLNWFEQYLRPLVKESLHSANGRPIRVHLTLQGGSHEMKKQWQPTVDLTPDPLYSTCTFETYFSGSTNEATIQLFKEALLNKSFNPIYLQGPSGIGKTHLLMAAAHLLKEQKKSVFYVKADRFTQHIVAAIKSSAMTLLRQQYRKHDVLVIDEIETLAGRSASQEELFHTFNTLHLAGKQIIVAGKELPAHLKEIEPRLTSRFEWGLVLTIKPLTAPELNTYLKQFLPETVIPQLLSLFTTIPLLNRAVSILKVRLKDPTTPVVINQWLSSLIQEQQKKALTSDVILSAVASHFDIHLADLQGRSQTQEHATPRQIAMYLCRKQLNLPYMKIAGLFSRDHSTVMTSVKLIDKRLQDNPPIQTAVHEILEKLS